jgi:hypothetical protein
MAALQAEVRKFQKLINKKEQIPTPSQPAKKIHKFDDVIKIIIKNVNNEM